MSYLEKPLKKYLDDAASGESTPGGGSVSALVGALGSTMASMSSRFTVGKKKFIDVEPKVKEILEKCDKARGELLGLMEEDINSYSKVSESYCMPKSNDEEKKARTEAIQAALKVAMEAPLKTVRCSLNMLENIRELSDIANPNLISDVGVAVLFTNAALLGGKLNVDINLAFIKDTEITGKIGDEMKQAESRAQTLLIETMDVVKSKM